jgi:UDP-N-acetyl-2-amino-2-deoxyglucuronate dehydrogenase
MKQNLDFGLIGAAGFVAPRHLQAIKASGGILQAAYDPHDCVGILDSFFPNAAFFTEFERFDRHIDKLSRDTHGLDFCSICSPNYLHDAHIRFALRNGAHAICEKPLVLNPWNLDSLEVLSAQSERSIYTILQLRHHPDVQRLKQALSSGSEQKRHQVQLTYITARGKWYYSSWKADIEKSGGIVTNIGIHFFDMLIWLFGKVESSTVHLLTHDRACGILHLENADIQWFLGINAELLPTPILEEGRTTYRNIEVNGQTLEFSSGFTDLHIASYRAILEGDGFGISEARASIELCSLIRNDLPVGLQGDYHPLANQPLSLHPFKKI